MSALQAFAQLDTNLLRDIKSWRRGDAPPTRLIKFPDGKIEILPECGLRVWGSAVEDYVAEIRDVALLAALIFDSRTQPDTFRAAVSRLISLKDVSYLSSLLAEKRKTDASAFNRSELAVLSELLRFPYIAVQVARIASEDMPTEKAERVLLGMKKELEIGASWAEAYRKHSELNPDLDRAKNPKSVRTLICYLYHGTISETGFDVLTYRAAENLPVTQLRELFRAKQGTHLLKATDGVYLYHILGFYDDSN